VATLAALTVADLRRFLADWPDALTDTALADLHEVLIRTTASASQPPTDLLAEVRSRIDATDDSLIESLAPRPRVAFRLLRRGADDAAWMVLEDTATGVVDAGYQASTTAGQPLTVLKLPLVIVNEAPHSFADLPGFRDPRYDAPDACYDISSAVKLRAHVDDAVLSRSSPLLLAGWAALDLLTTGPDETVRVVAVGPECEVSWPARRHRRADLVTGTGEGLRRRAWAGWSAEVDPGGLSSGTWALSVEVDHEGIVRRTRLGGSVSDLAARAVGVKSGDSARPARLKFRKERWVIAVE
jgi:hypothetical protein